MAASAATNNTNRDSFISINSIYLNEYIYKWFTIHITNEETLEKLRSPHQTHSIEKYPCRVYLIDYEPSKCIRIWLNEEEAQINKCSDYMDDLCTQDKMQSCWVCKWVDIHNDWLIDPDEQIDETIIDKPDFYRLRGDRFIEFGDGGEAFLIYPVWIHEHLPVSESCRKRLLNILYQLNQERQDFHPSPSPVEDIIDPDLLSHRPSSTFDRNQWIARKKKQLEADERRSRQFIRDLNQNEYDDLSEHEQIRDRYHWLPSEFLIDKDGNVKIQTPIHHLPLLSEYEQSYDDIAHIFHAMLPMFEQMKLIKINSNEEERLQVIVKAQSYNLKAG